MDAISAHNTFALGLYKAFAEENAGKSFLLSPVSIFATLSMLLPGAREETLHNMLAAMHLNSAAPLEETEAALGKVLAAAIGTGAAGSAAGSELLLANKVYIEAGYEVRKEYVGALQNYFAAEIASASFGKNPDAERSAINDWVKAATKGKIPELLIPGSLSTLTRLVLVNALYFKAKWVVPFDPKATRDGSFELSADSPPVTVPMMRRMANFPLVYVPDALTGVRLDFLGTGDQPMALFAILPAERHGLDALMAKMSSDAWLQVVNAPVESSRAVVSLPKARLSSRAELSQPNYLPKLGLASLFGASADLSGIASVPGDLHVSGFSHQAVLEWDEIGAEGAAASAAAVNTRSMPLELRFDQPFLVIVARKAEAGQRVPIFVGRVVDPRS